MGLIRGRLAGSIQPKGGSVRQREFGIRPFFGSGEGVGEGNGQPDNPAIAHEIPLFLLANACSTFPGSLH